MVPDRAIERKVKEYDPDLFFKWNNEKQYFELWRHFPDVGYKLITPITYSIYESNGPKIFCPLDERILVWLYAADSWRQGGHKKYAIENDRRWKEFLINAKKKQIQTYRDLGKDAYAFGAAFFTTKHARKNGKPKFNNHKPQNQWIRPDKQSLANPRAFARSRANALAYGYKKCS